MFKRIASLWLLLITVLMTSNISEARVKKSKIKKNKRQKTYKVSKHKRKSRHYKRGNGPDLKTITTNNPYTEETNNGVNPIETKQPGI